MGNVIIIIFLSFFICFCNISFAAEEQIILEGHTGTVTSVTFTPDGKLLTSGSYDTTIKIWDPKSGKELATLISLDKNDWIVVTPEGFFDGSPGGMGLIRWKIGYNYYFLEQFFNEFYHPGLLSDIYRECKSIPEILKDRKDPRASLNIANKDRRLPVVSISAPENSSERNVKIKITFDEIPPGNDYHTGSGVKDLRLFRNGTLLKIWPGELKPATVTCDVPLMAGENIFTAYAFNRDNIKSQDSIVTVTGDKILKREPVVYILSIGINKYSSRELNLNYAVKDAVDISETLSKNLPPGKIEITTLLDGRATREGILNAIKSIVMKSQPEDTVIITYAGHGINFGGKFFIIPHDIGSEEHLTEKVIEERGISDRELYNILVGDDKTPGLQAQHIMLILDACFSGQALESEEWRVGPMNSLGLAQLAWEKGMDIVTASQSNQVANELKKLQHGILTSCLLNSFSKAPRENNKLFAKSWIDYAVNEVPKILESDECRSVILNYKGADKQVITFQTPRVFHGRNDDWIVSLKK